MQESRESSVCLHTSPPLLPPSICTNDKLPSEGHNSRPPSFNKRASKASPPINNTNNASHCEDDRVVPNTGCEEILSASDQEAKTCDPSAIDISTGCKGVRRCATFPRTDGQVTVPRSVLGGAQDAVIDTPPAYERSVSFPTCLKSALKGSRTETPRSADLHVKWAPDVYDPPVTSQSHTVQSHSGRKGSNGGSSSKGRKKGRKKDKRKNKG